MGWGGGGGGVLQKVSYRDALPRGLNPYPFISYFDRKGTPFRRSFPIYSCRALRGVQYPPHPTGTAIICICRGQRNRKFHGGVSLRRQLTFSNVTLTVSLQNDVWGTNAEIPCRWCVTNWIRFVILIGWSKFPTRHDQLKEHYQECVHVYT